MQRRLQYVEVVIAGSSSTTIIGNFATMNNQGRNGEVYNTSENNESYSTPTGIESHSESNSSTILNGIQNRESVGATVDQDVSMHLPLKRTSTQIEIGESSSLISVHHNAHNFQRNNINQGNTIFAPQARRGAFYLRSLLNHHEQSSFNVGINQLNGLEWVPQINMNQQEYSSSTTSNAIQVGGNDEQPPHIMSTDDPELMRAMMQIEIETIMERIHIGQLLRLQLQRRHIRTESGLTENEIKKCITCENFEATVEGTSGNKELCCICQEEYQTGEEIGKLDCAHIFHMNCIKQWLAEKNICPLCNRRGLFVVGDEIDG